MAVQAEHYVLRVVKGKAVAGRRDFRRQKAIINSILSGRLTSALITPHILKIAQRADGYPTRIFPAVVEAACIAADVMRGVRIAAVYGNVVCRRQQDRSRRGLLRLLLGGLGLLLRGRLLLFLRGGLLLFLGSRLLLSRRGRFRPLGDRRVLSSGGRFLSPGDGLLLRRRLLRRVPGAQRRRGRQRRQAQGQREKQAQGFLSHGSFLPYVQISRSRKWSTAVVLRMKYGGQGGIPPCGGRGPVALPRAGRSPALFLYEVHYTPHVYVRYKPLFVFLLKYF